MDWREHTDEHHIIETHKGGERFKDVASSILMSVAYRAFKTRLPQQQHASLDQIWHYASYGPNDTALHKAKHFIHGEIAAIIDTVDHHFGAPGRRGSDWMDAKARHIADQVASLFSQGR